MLATDGSSTFRFILIFQLWVAYCCAAVISFHCAADGTWIMIGQVCNGVVDCPTDAADEKYCFAFKPFAVDQVFKTKNAATQITASTDNACLQLVIQAGISNDPADGAAFSFNTVSSVCTIYSQPAVSQYLHDPATVLVANQGATLYVLPSSTGTLSPCTRVWSCNGNGAAVTQKDQTCRCVCDEKFSGADCSDVLTLGSVQDVFLVFGKSGGIQISFVESALLAVAPSASVACRYPEMTPLGNVAVKCSLQPTTTPSQDIARVLLMPATLSAVNAALSSKRHPVATLISAQSIQSDIAFDCTIKNSGSVICNNTGNFTSSGGFLRVRFAVGTSVNVASALTLSVRQYPSAIVTTARCQPLATTLPTGCYVITCVAELSTPINISSVLVAVNPGAIDQSQVCFKAPNLSAVTSFTLPTVASEDNRPMYDDSLNKTLLYVAFTIFGFSFVCALVAILSTVAENRTLARIDDQYKGQGTVRDYLLQLFHRNARYEDTSRCWRSEDAAPAFAIVFLNFLVVAVIVALCAFTFSPTTKHAAMVQFFRDVYCSGSPFSPAPFAVGAINSTWDLDCTQVNVLGSFSSKLFASAKCIDPGAAMLILAATQSQCKYAGQVPIATKQCLPLSQFFPGSAGYFELRCGLSIDIASAWNSLAPFDRVESIALTASSVLNIPVSTPTTTSGGVTLTPYVYAGGALFNSSTAQSGRYDAYASMSSRNAARVSAEMNTSKGLWLVLQTNETYVSPANVKNPASSVTGQLERQYSTVVSNLSSADLDSLAALTIPSQDYPVGTIFNSFDPASDPSAVALQDKQAGPGSHRYFGIAGSSADIGAVLGPESFFVTDDGLTISFKLRATNVTRGFIFAVSDAYDNVESFSSPLMSSLVDIIQKGASGASWSSEYYVYSSLYLDGSAGTLSYVAAEPPQSTQRSYDATSNTLTNLQWDLRSLGLGFVFNGYWHDVHVILRNENSRVKAQLVVDAITSRTLPGWSLCLDRRPRAVQTFQVGQQAPVYSSSERVFAGGELLVGYLNGGVGDLTFTRRILSTSEILAASSMFVKTSQSPNLVLNLALALILFGFAALCGLLTLFTSGWDLFQASKLRRRLQVISAAAAYANLMSSPVVDDNQKPLTPIKYVTARRWLDVSHSQFAALMDEIRENTANPGRELYRTLFATKEASKLGLRDLTHVGLPSASAWNAAVTADEEELETFLCIFKRKRVEVDPAETSALSSEYANTTQIGQVRKPGAVEFDTSKLRVGFSNSKATNSSSAGNAAATSELYQMALPIITTIQTAYVYMTTVQIPPEYRAKFSAFMSFLSIDFSVAFPRVPEIVTPLMQIILGLLAISLFFYFCTVDQRSFFIHLARYTLKRDVLKDWSQKELYRPGQKMQGDLLTLQEIADNVRVHDELTQVAQSLAVPYGHDVQCDYECHARVLSVRESKRIDQFIETAQRGDVIDVCDDYSHSYKLKKDAVVDKADGSLRETVCIAASTADCSQFLETVGVHCRLHHCRLTPREHSDVFPFAFQPTCCVYVNGSRCNQSCGLFYSCSYFSRTANGGIKKCEYGVCQKHFRGTLWDEVAAELCGFLRSIRERNWTWTFSVAILFIGNALYTPLVQTALMIVSCNSYYQCQFPLCYATRSTIFYVTITLAVVMLLSLGIGFPLVQFRMLWIRKIGMGKCFFAPEYAGRYTTSQSAEGKATLSLTEWSRFTSSDPTALASVYSALQFNWIFLPPFLLVAKSILIIPAIVLEPDSSEQKIGVAVVQIVYCVFVFVTAPFLSPIANAMYRVGSIHQLLLLGLQCMSVYSKQQSSWTALMVVVTLAYLSICAACFVWIIVVPIVRERLDLAATAAKLKLFGLQYSQTTSLFLVPSTELGFTTTARPGVETADNMTNPSGRMLLRMFGLLVEDPLEKMAEDTPVMNFDFDVEANLGRTDRGAGDAGKESKPSLSW